MRYLDIEQYAPEWWSGAVCRGLGNKIFFGDDETHTSLREVRKMCVVCPVAKECLTHALTTPEEYGIWAGTSARNRTHMVRAIESGVEVAEIVAKVISNKFRWREYG